MLRDNVHALVTFNSNAAVESVINGVPVFVTAPVHVASPVGNRDLTRIDDPFWPDQDLLTKWFHHLAYCQYHISEMKTGIAYRMLNDN